MNRDPDPVAYTLMRVAIRRLSRGPLADQIHWAADIEEAAQWDLGQRIALARRNRLLTWAQIADAVGTTPQSAHRRYVERRVEDEGLAAQAQSLIISSRMLDDVINTI